MAHESTKGRSTSTSSLNGGATSEGAEIDENLKIVGDPFCDESIQLFFRKLKVSNSAIKELSIYWIVV